MLSLPFFGKEHALISLFALLFGAGSACDDDRWIWVTPENMVSTRVQVQLDTSPGSPHEVIVRVPKMNWNVELSGAFLYLGGFEHRELSDEPDVTAYLRFFEDEHFDEMMMTKMWLSEEEVGRVSINAMYTPPTSFCGGKSLLLSDLKALSEAGG